MLLVPLYAEEQSQNDRKSSASGKPVLRILVPAYFYPSGDGARHWDRLFEASAEAPIVAVVNPASGPGKRADANYTKILARIKKSKLTPIGYVTTSYGKRSLAEVRGDVDQWLRLYPGIQGVFFDEQASAAEHVDYYATLRAHVREKHELQLVVTNPGTVCSEQFLSKSAADAVCLFEGKKPFDADAFPEWITKYSPDRFAVLSYNVEKADEMRRCIKLAERTVAYVYVTDATGANPWDRLPRYWDELVAAVRDANRPAALK
jgi:hypothetical protein